MLERIEFLLNLSKQIQEHKNKLNIYLYDAFVERLFLIRNEICLWELKKKKLINLHSFFFHS